MWKLLALTCCLAVASSSVLNEWASFKAKHGKKYANDLEEQHRYNIFVANKKKIEEHNAKFEAGLSTYKMGMNQFGDMTHEEFLSTMTGFNKSRPALRSRSGLKFVPTNDPIPAAIDWRTKGAVTQVKDQGQCGSCWAFSATGSVEGQVFLKKGNLISLSEQNIVDCSKSGENEGCNGGLMDDAFNDIQAEGGIQSEKDYPYTARDGKCKFDKSKAVATVTGLVDIPEGDEKALAQAVATVGPVSIALNADLVQLYDSGIIDDQYCSKNLDHGVLAVGYGTENGKDFWIVKNSWGASYGEKGYFRIARGKNLCGLALLASYPLV